MNKTELYQKAIDTWGIDDQIMMLIEECGELLSAINKFSRGRISEDDLISEFADVEIMADQLAEHFSWRKRIERIKEEKLKRLAGRLGVEYESA